MVWQNQGGFCGSSAAVRRWPGPASDILSRSRIIVNYIICLGNNTLPKTVPKATSALASRIGQNLGKCDVSLNRVKTGPRRRINLDEGCWFDLFRSSFAS
jgi:hypothetical protein